MAEHGQPIDTDAVLGIALDGLGFGQDGSLWGGEFLLADYLGFRRLAAFQPTHMPGGVQAIREPWRNTYAHLVASLGWEEVRSRFPHLDIVKFLERKPLATLDRMKERGVNSPLASSAGRLFDAVGAALGFCTETASFEGQAAVELESVASVRFADEQPNAYPFAWEEMKGIGKIRWAPMWQSLLQDLASGTETAAVAARFHQAVVLAVAETTRRLVAKHAMTRVVLSGGVFQNKLLLEGVSDLLKRQGLTVLLPERIPANDGGLSLGQAVIAAARYLKR